MNSVHIFLIAIVIPPHSTEKYCNPMAIVQRITSVKGSSHDAITNAFFLSQLMGCMGDSIVVSNTPCEHLY